MRTLAAFAVLALAGLAAGPARAHGGAHAEHAGWTFDAWIAAPLFISAALYLCGGVRLWRRGARARGASTWRTRSYAAGWLTLAGALVSPLHELGEQLFTFHMIEHELIMAIAAPLLIVARPLGVLLWGLPRLARSAMARLTRSLALRAFAARTCSMPVATMLHGAAIWLWHAPPLLEAAITNPAVHRLQHLSFFVTALLFWHALLRNRHYGAAAWHLFITMLHMSLLAALTTLAPRVLYETQTAGAPAWGLTPLEDQQLAGLVMWAPGCAIYAMAAIICAGLWIRRSSAGGFRAITLA